MSPLEAPGDLFADRFRLEREVDRTGDIVTFEAIDEADARRVDVEIATSSGGGPRKTAAEIAARLSGPHVLRIVATGETPDGRAYVAREPMRMTAADALGSPGALDIPRAIAWTLELCEALAEAHASGIAHGEVALDNVVLAVADPSAGDDDALRTVKLRWTATTTGEGLSREDVRADLVGVGAVLRALATGGADPDDAPTLPSAVAYAVARACAGGDDGFRNVAELARAIAPFAPPGHLSAGIATYLLSRAGVVGSAIPSPPAERTCEPWPAAIETSRATSRRRLAFALALLALLGALVGGVLALWRTGRLLRTATRAESAATQPEVQPTEAPELGTRAKADSVRRRAGQDASRRRRERRASPRRPGGARGRGRPARPCPRRSGAVYSNDVTARQR